MEQHAAPLAALAAASQQQLDSYKQQHEAFVQHALQQIQQLQQQLEIEQQVWYTRGPLKPYSRTLGYRPLFWKGEGFLRFVCLFSECLVEDV